MFVDVNVKKDYHYVGFDLNVIQKGDMVISEVEYKDYTTAGYPLVTKEVRGVVDEVTDKYMKVNAGIFTRHIAPHELVSIQIYKED